MTSSMCARIQVSKIIFKDLGDKLFVHLKKIKCYFFYAYMYNIIQ